MSDKKGGGCRAGHENLIWLTPGRPNERPGAAAARARKVRDELQRRLHDLLPKLGIDDRQRGKLLLTKNPLRPENTRKGNFAIWLTGAGPGAGRTTGPAASCAATSGT